MRRIEAVTGVGALDYLRETEHELQGGRAAQDLARGGSSSAWRPRSAGEGAGEEARGGAPPAQAGLQQGSAQPGARGQRGEGAHPEVGGGPKIFRGLADQLRDQLQSGVVAIGGEKDGKALILVAATKDMVARGIKRGDLIREMAKEVGGKGGGKPDMAQAGGADPSRIAAALDKLYELVEGQPSRPALLEPAVGGTCQGTDGGASRPRRRSLPPSRLPPPRPPRVRSPPSPGGPRRMSDAKLLPLRVRLPLPGRGRVPRPVRRQRRTRWRLHRHARPKPEGTALAFEFLLADGTRMLRGEGVVVKVQGDEASGRGMTVRFTRAWMPEQGAGGPHPRPPCPGAEPAAPAPSPAPGAAPSASTEAQGAEAAPLRLHDDAAGLACPALLSAAAPSGRGPPGRRRRPSRRQRCPRLPSRRRPARRRRTGPGTRAPDPRRRPGPPRAARAPAEPTASDQPRGDASAAAPAPSPARSGRAHPEPSAEQHSAAPPGAEGAHPPPQRALLPAARPALQARGAEAESRTAGARPRAGAAPLAPRRRATSRCWASPRRALGARPSSTRAAPHPPHRPCALACPPRALD